MSLDFLALGGQVRAMSGALRDELRTLPQRIAFARDLLLSAADEWERWQEVVEQPGRAPSGLTAQPLERFDVVYDLPPCPTSYAVAATDGSQLDIDHHGIAACYVVNIGTALLQYGPDACFRAGSVPELGFSDDDLIIRDERTGKEWVKEGAYLAAYRDVSEGLALAHLATELPDDRPRLALQDGTLLRWQFTNFDEPLRNHFLQNYLSYFDTMQALACPVVSYLSRPRSPEVLGLAKLIRSQARQHSGHASNGDPAGDPLRGLVDYMLFEQLADGQRSARWGSMSRINVEFYGPHRIQFFYLRVEREMARVEFPAWVADDGYLDLLHAIVYDQCRRGMGYPNVIARAHEQAVIHSDERRRIGDLIERVFVQNNVPTIRSAKSTSKLQPGA